jgi:ferrochelatase
MTSDAVLLIGFGGPEGPDEVLPFLRRVTAGKNIPDERLIEVGRHYDHFGGVSPINQFHRDLLDRWRPLLEQRWPGLPLYWGNRNTPPFIADALRRMQQDGVRSATAVVTSAFSSFSGCRQYREDIAAAHAEVPDGPAVVKAHPFFDHPLMVEMWADSVRGGLADLGPGGNVLVLFSTHSIPDAAARAAGPGGTGAYVSQHRELAAAVMERVGQPLTWDLCYQSRSGPPQQPWLEPDVSDRLATAAEAGVTGVVLVPLGFVSDHIEVLWDLDTVAVTDAGELGLPIVRTPTVGTDDRFLTVLTDLVAEYRGEAAFPSFRAEGPLPACPANCCLPVRPARPSGTMAT